MTTQRVSNCYRHRFKQKERKFNRKRPLIAYLRSFVTKECKILDLGSGPFSTIGTEGDITLCDILADEYNAMMERRGIVPVVPVEKQDMDNLTYPANRFSVVHCRNALDHTIDPKRALREMNRVCKADGLIYLRHYPNVGETNNYSGDHRWNIIYENTDCKVWNENEEFLLSEIFPDHFTFLHNNMIVTMSRKNGES